MLEVSHIFNNKTQNIETHHAILNAMINQKHETRIMRLTLSYNFESSKIVLKYLKQASDEI